MARQQSSSELAGTLAATLTPSVPHVSAQRFRANQNSGLFDVGALYAETLDDVLRRTRADARLAPLARAAREPSIASHARDAQSLGRIAQPFGRPALPFARSAEPAWPLATRGPQPVLWIDVEAEAVPIEFIDFAAAPRPRGLGWYGVAVAWLATITTAAMIAISLPGHVVTHARAGLIPIVAATPAPTSTPPVTASAPVLAMSPPVVPAAVPVWSLPVAAAAPALSPPGVSASTWPASAPPRPVVHTSAPPGSMIISTKRTAPRPAPGKSAGVNSAPLAVRAGPVQVTAAMSSPSAPAIAAAPRPSPPAKAAPPSTAGMSLDELIRHEVQVESAKHK
jgi:hypothetical protein